MKVFKHLQLISIKPPIFNVSLNIFLFNSYKNIECLQIFTVLGVQII